MKLTKASLDRMLREARLKVGRDLSDRTGKQQEQYLRECVERAYADIGEKPLWARVKRAGVRRRRHASA